MNCMYCSCGIFGLCSVYCVNFEVLVVITLSDCLACVYRVTDARGELGEQV